MPATDTSESGPEALICRALAGQDCAPSRDRDAREPATAYGGFGRIGSDRPDHDREYCVDRVQLRGFLEVAQPEVATALHLAADDPTRRKFLARLQGEITKRGTITVQGMTRSSSGSTRTTPTFGAG